MGKRKRDKSESDVATTAPAFSNPFAGLAALRDGLPPASEPAEPATAGSAGAIARPADVPPPMGSELGACGKIVVRREKKGRAGKTVTRIDGLPTAELPALAKRLKSALGCGATVEGPSLLLLGSLVERAAAWLVAQGAKRVVSNP